MAVVIGLSNGASAKDFWSLDTLKFWKRDKDQPEAQPQPPIQPDPGTGQVPLVQPAPTELPQDQQGGAVQPAPGQPVAPAPTVQTGPIPPADIPNTPDDGGGVDAAAPLPALAGQFQGIWGLSKDVCTGTRTIEDIGDDQALAIKGNRVFFSDSQCRVLQTEGDYASGQKVLIRCVDIDNQRYETEVLIRPLGEKKLEISSGDQSSLQYDYCAPAQGTEPAEAVDLDKPVVPEPGAAQKDLISQ
ncbi:MAG: hypothetical protein ABJN26_18340 [Stappiaceae bacterium]